MGTDTFSVVFTTYGSDDPSEVRTAFNSIVDQTVVPDEIVIVKDGPVPGPLSDAIATFGRDYPRLVAIYSLSENCGHGKALQIGVERCSHELVAIMDADDISVRTRFERQLSYLEDNPEVDLVGGYIAEFDDDPDDVVSVRKVPTSPARVERKARYRSPVNQTTAMFRRSTVINAGNYRGVARMEDYDLWGRILANGATIANIPEVLAKVRGGTAMHSRRGGLEYAREEVRQQWLFLRIGFVSVPAFILNLLIRIPVRLLPNRVRGLIYDWILRTDG